MISVRRTCKGKSDVGLAVRRKKRKVIERAYCREENSCIRIFHRRPRYKIEIFRSYKRYNVIFRYIYIVAICSVRKEFSFAEIKLILVVVLIGTVKTFIIQNSVVFVLSRFKSCAVEIESVLFINFRIVYPVAHSDDYLRLYIGKICENAVIEIVLIQHVPRGIYELICAHSRIGDALVRLYIYNGFSFTVDNTVDTEFFCGIDSRADIVSELQRYDSGITGKKRF